MPILHPLKSIDPIVKEFYIKECAVDNAIIPIGRKRRIARKVYRALKAAFFGAPVMGVVLADLFTEVAYAGTEKMVQKIPWVALGAILPAGVVTTGICIYKVTTSETIRRPVALITNIAGACYTIPMWINDHSALYFVEKVLFGAPVPLFPEGRIRIIANETTETEISSTIRAALDTYYKEVGISTLGDLTDS